MGERRQTKRGTQQHWRRNLLGAARQLGLWYGCKGLTWLADTLITLPARSRQVSPVTRSTSAGQPVGGRSTGARRRSEAMRAWDGVSGMLGSSLRARAGDAGHGTQRCALLLILPLRRYEMGRQPANTKLSNNVAVRRVRVRGGNYKFRALRLDHGNFSWGSEVRRRQLWRAAAAAAGGGRPNSSGGGGSSRLFQRQRPVTGAARSTLVGMAAGQAWGSRGSRLLCGRSGLPPAAAAVQLSADQPASCRSPTAAVQRARLTARGARGREQVVGRARRRGVAGG
jgi:ribosomal protein S8E